MNLYFAKNHKTTGELTHFDELVLSGHKIHTFRAGSKANAGESLKMISGEKGKSVDAFNTERSDLSTIISTQKAVITTKKEAYNGIDYRIYIDDRRLTENECKILARNEGFSSLYDFLMWFVDTPVWEGLIIHWTTLTY